MCPIHIPRALTRFRKSYALLSTSDACKQVAIFVHGFFGRATSTWRNFQGLIDEPESVGHWGSTDLFFYEYDSRRPILVSAQDFSAFVNTVLEGDIERIAPTRPVLESMFSLPVSGWNKRLYSSLLLIAHSEGGVVIRRALLDRLGALEREVESELDSHAREQKIVDEVRNRGKADLALNARLRLFAPACLGINFSSMFGFALSYSDILCAIAASFPARNDLADNSPIIIQIKDETESAAKRYPSLSSFRAQMLFGERDHIVHIGGYRNDLILPYEKYHSHTSICKPDDKYLKPLEFAQ